MTEFVMKDLVKQAGLEDQFQIASAATSTEEIGNPVCPPAGSWRSTEFAALEKPPGSSQRPTTPNTIS